MLWPPMLVAAPPAGGKGEKGPPPAALVVTEEVREEAVAPTILVTGSVEPLHESRVAARMAGVVAEGHAQPGEAVAAGAPLLTLDPAEGAREKRMREADLAEARARLTKAEQDLERDRKLVGSDAVSKQRMAEREAEAAVRRALLHKAEAALALAADQLEWLTIRAPFAGVVTQRMPAPGQWVGRGESVTTLVETAALEIVALLPASLVAALTPGSAAQAALGDGSGPWFPVQLRAAVPRLDPVSRNRATYWRSVGELSQPFMAGQEARLRIPDGPARTLLLVPKDGVIREKGETRVLLQEGEEARQVTVQLGEAVGEKFHVLEGVKAGDKVVVRGNERLRSGQSVRTAPTPKEEASTAPKPGTPP